MSFQNHRAYNSMYQKDKMTFVFILPTARMSKNPIMENQLHLACKIEEYGFASLWIRDITMQNLNIDDNGQYDLWIYLTYLAAFTKHIPVRNRKCSSPFAPRRVDRWTDMRLIPKLVSTIPTMVIGFSNQSINWIARNGDGWRLQYPRSIIQQAQLIQDYRALTEVHAPGDFKHFSQSLFIDLSENPDEIPVPIPLGYSVGRNRLVDLLHQCRSKHACASHS